MRTRLVSKTQLPTWSGAIRAPLAALLPRFERSCLGRRADKAGLEPHRSSAVLNSRAMGVPQGRQLGGQGPPPLGPSPSPALLQAFTASPRCSFGCSRSEGSAVLWLKWSLLWLSPSVHSSFPRDFPGAGKALVVMNLLPPQDGVPWKRPCQTQPPPLLPAHPRVRPPQAALVIPSHLVNFFFPVNFSLPWLL